LIAALLLAATPGPRIANVVARTAMCVATQASIEWTSLASFIAAVPMRQ
jgi:hypothetical protein